MMPKILPRQSIELARDISALYVLALRGRLRPMKLISKKSTTADRLSALRSTTDMLTVGRDASLMIEDCRAPDLVERFGSPLYVVSENTLRRNYRRIREAFEGCWPAPVNVLYAIKSNNCLAIRAVLSSEGAGGECFGDSELYATLLAGTNPDRIVINGSNKTRLELWRAAQLGLTVIVDHPDEISILADAANHFDRVVNVKLRLKLPLRALKGVPSDYFGVDGKLPKYLADEKWGVSPKLAENLIKRIRRTRGLQLTGYSLHVGRISRDPFVFTTWANVLGRAVVELQARTGFAPKALDIGGGWPRERDPEGRILALNPVPIESYARCVCDALLAHLHKAEIDIPDLWLEPGRYIVGNAAILLCTVGAIKSDSGQIWVNVDASTNNLMRIDTSRSAYHILAATRMGRSLVQHGTVVGSTCIDSTLGTNVHLPRLRRGDLLAILDAGMYADAASTQFNGVPRPASVLANGSDACLVKQRETIQDVFSKHIVPDRLALVAGQLSAAAYLASSVPPDSRER